jgi:hypothetical protein
VEDSRSAEENPGIRGRASSGLASLHHNSSWYLRQIQSARNLINTFSDRFEVVLPSRGELHIQMMTPSVKGTAGYRQRVRQDWQNLRRARHYGLGTTKMTYNF